MQQRTRILFVITTFSVGGAERHLYDLVRSLPKDEFEVGVAFFKEEAQEARSLVPDFQALGIEPVNLGMASRVGPAGIAGGLWRLRRLMQRWKPDIVHAHLYRAELFSVFAARTLRHGPAVVCTMHNADLYSVGPRWKALLAQAYKRADKVITLFPSDTANLVRNRGISAKRVVDILHGIDVAKWQGAASTGGPPTIGTIGRLAKQKAQDVLLRAFALVLVRVPDARLVIVGHDDELLLPTLTALAQALGVREAVEFRGYVDDPSDFLHGINVFTLSSDWEGLPISLLEAMAAGCPVVATDVGGIAEVVVEGETGLLVPPQSPEALAEALVRVLSDPSRAAAMGQAGQRRAETAFGIARMRDETIAVYREVARG